MTGLDQKYFPLQPILSHAPPCCFVLPACPCLPPFLKSRGVGCSSGEWWALRTTSCRASCWSPGAGWLGGKGTMASGWEHAVNAHGRPPSSDTCPKLLRGHLRPRSCCLAEAPAQILPKVESPGEGGPKAAHWQLPSLRGSGGGHIEISVSPSFGPFRQGVTLLSPHPGPASLCRTLSLSLACRGEGEGS